MGVKKKVVKEYDYMVDVLDPFGIRSDNNKQLPRNDQHLQEYKEQKYGRNTIFSKSGQAG